VPNEQAQLDQLGLGELPAEFRPGLVGQLTPLVQVIGRPHQRALPLRPSVSEP
jgi:hypothetical protein